MVIEGLDVLIVFMSCKKKKIESHTFLTGYDCSRFFLYFFATVVPQTWGSFTTIYIRFSFISVKIIA